MLNFAFLVCVLSKVIYVFKVSFLEISGVFAPFTNEVKSILAHFLNSCFRQVFVVSTKND